jgi:hypothetical protein
MTTAAQETVPNPSLLNQYNGPGFYVQDAVALNAWFVDSAIDTLTANAGGRRTNPLQITTQNARLSRRSHRPATASTQGSNKLLHGLAHGLSVVGHPVEVTTLPG